MKKLLLILLFQASLSAVSQNLKAVTLVPQRTYHLNGGARATYAGGTSRETIRIELPPNTKSWYYSFTTTPAGDGTQLLNLALQLSASKYAGISGPALASSIKVPNGSGSADVFLLTSPSRDAFLYKQDGAWRFFKDASLKNATQAVQYVDVNYGTTLYLGLRNPSSLTGIYITIEAVAIVEE